MSADGRVSDLGLFHLGHLSMPPSLPLSSISRAKPTLCEPESTGTPSMVDLTAPASSAAARPIASATSPTSPSADGPSSSFRLPTSSVSRKKPLGLSISSSGPRASRPAPLLPDGTPDLSVLGAGPSSGSSRGLSDAEQLRQDIERLQALQLSGRSSSSRGNLPDSVEEGAWAGQSPGLSGDGTGGKKKSATGTGKTRRRGRDAEDMVKDEDLEVLDDLGAGNGGTVTKVFNKKLGQVMAKKVSIWTYH